MANKRIRRTNNFSSYLAAATQDNIDLKNRNNISDIGESTISGVNLANDVSISTSSIFSSDYSEGTSGWKIDGTGVAEFSNVFVRGDINAYSGTIGYWNISSPGVERTIGGKRLFGTFLESENLGDIDSDNSPGVYVGLFRSYREDAVNITSASRRNGIATVVSAGHGYKTGDLVSVNLTGTLDYQTESIRVVSKNVTSNVATLTLEIAHSCQVGDSITVSGVGSPFDGTFTVIAGTIDKVLKFAVSNTDVTETEVTDITAIVVQNVVDSGLTFSSGSSYFTIIDANYDSFKYENSGVNTDFNRGVAFVGTSQLYDENIAGLYLQDYSRSLFDYGYFSNEGIKYVSAEVYNAILNPSFEYKDIITETIEPSYTEWSASSVSTTIDTYALSDYYSSYIGSSSYGLQISWSSATSDYVIGSVDYSVLDKYVARNKDLYFNFDIFVNPFIRRLEPTSISVSGDTLQFSCTDHGLVTGDTLYNYSDTTGTNLVFATNTLAPVTVVDSDTFSVANTQGHGVEWTSTGTGNYIYLFTLPRYNMSEIAFKFPNSSTTVPLSDLVTDDIKAAWDAEGSLVEILTASEDDLLIHDYYSMYISSDELSIVVEKIPKLTPTVVGDVFTTKSKSVVKIDISKLYSKYRTLDTTGLSNKSNISVLFPAWIDNSADTKIPDHSIVIDNVYLSTDDKFFYGDSNESSTSWYDGFADEDTFSYSIEASKNWLSIDLASQTAVINYLDAVGFKSSTFNGSLFTNSGIYGDNTNYEYNEALDISTNIEDASDSALVVTSGRYRKYLTAKSAEIYSIEVTNLELHLFTITTVDTHAFTTADSIFITESNNDDFNSIYSGLAITSVPSNTTIVVYNPLATSGDAYNSELGNGTISNYPYDILEFESYASSRVTKSFTSYQISSVMDLYDSSDAYGIVRTGVSSADIALESDEAWAEIVISSDIVNIKNRNLDPGRNNLNTQFDRKTALQLNIEGSVGITNGVSDPNYLYFIDNITDGGSGTYTLDIDTATDEYHRLAVGDSIRLTDTAGGTWTTAVTAKPDNTSITFTETAEAFDFNDYIGGYVEKIYLSYPYITDNIPLTKTSETGKHYLATIDYVASKSAAVVSSVLSTAFADPLSFDGTEVTLNIGDTLTVDAETGSLGADVDAITTSVLASITASEPLDLTDGTLSITSGYVYNEDQVSYVKLWVGASEPASPTTGDVWIATA